MQIKKTKSKFLFICNSNYFTRNYINIKRFFKVSWNKNILNGFLSVYDLEFIIPVNNLLKSILRFYIYSRFIFLFIKNNSNNNSGKSKFIFINANNSINNNENYLL